MFDLPTSVCIQGEQFSIRNDGDYRMVLDCFSAMQDEKLTEEERIIVPLTIFYDTIQSVDDLDNLPDIKEAIEQMYLFFNCGQEDKGVQNNKKHYKLIDWKEDEQLLASAINNVANIEIRSLPYLHWWTFMGYYNAIGECALSNIVSIRYKRITNTKLEKYEREFINDNPQYFMNDARSIEQRENDELLKQIWNKGE